MLRFQIASLLRATIASLLVGLLAALAACTRQSRRQRENGGGFGYYVLALSWTPGFCSHEPRNRHTQECGPGHERGFIVHGLWPEREGGRPLEYCTPVPRVNSDIITEMLPLMPDENLIQHEWRAHGSCSELSMERYFTTIRLAFERVHIPQGYRSLHRAVQTSPSEIERRFATANHLGGISAFRVQCRSGELTEVRVCLSRDLHPRPCSALRDCRAGELFIRPIQ